MARLRSHCARVALGLGTVVLAGCTPSAPGAGAAPARLYVANGADGTITRLDAATGRPLDPPVPAGRAPWQLVAGPGGRLLVLASSSPVGLTHAGPGGRGHGGWEARPVPVEAGASIPRLVGDGLGRAVLAYHVGVPHAAGAAGPPAAGCRLVVLDVATGAVEAVHAPCGPHEAITSLAIGDGRPGPVAYLGTWRHSPSAGAGAAPGGGRVLAIDLAGGGVAAEALLVGVPLHLVVAPAPGGSGDRVYCVEGSHSGGALELNTLLEFADRWLVRGLDPLTLASQGEVPLPGHLGQLTFSPDGGTAYALAVTGSMLLRLDPAAGTVAPLAALPGRAVTLAVVGDRIYVPNPYGSEVWALDRRTGRLVRTIPVGRGPVGITVGTG